MKNLIELTDKEFELFQKLIYKEIGISLENSKKSLLKTRFLKKLVEFDLSSYSDYYRLLQVNNDEKINMLNLITTNETYFFRESKHFEFLQKEIIPNVGNNCLRVWSAASSVGAEAYSIAMLVDDAKINYEIIGSDINSEVIKKANIGLYPIKWMDKIPEHLKIKYCLKGKGSHEGWFLIDRVLIKNMKFEVRNLMENQKDIGLVDVVFLRNVLIYFNLDVKKHIIENVLTHLRVGGYLFISLTEHINDLNSYGLKKISSSIFQKVK